MDKKQSVIDELHTQLRDASGELGEQRRRVEALQANANVREADKRKIANLLRAYEEERANFEQLKARYGQMGNEMDMHLGDADNGLAVGEQAAGALAKINPNPHQPLVIDRAERQLMASTLPPANVLRSRVNVYKANNEGLEDSVRGLQGKSSELAGKYRKIIGLCTGVDEDRVDAQLDNLLRAIESEPSDVELARVRDFLHRVEGV